MVATEEKGEGLTLTVGVKLKVVLPPLTPAPVATSAPSRVWGGEAAEEGEEDWFEWVMLAIWRWFLRISVLRRVCKRRKEMVGEAVRRHI